jgi:hypothetical protein
MGHLLGGDGVQRRGRGRPRGRGLRLSSRSAHDRQSSVSTQARPARAIGPAALIVLIVAARPAAVPTSHAASVPATSRLETRNSLRNSSSGLKNRDAIGKDTSSSGSSSCLKYIDRFDPIERLGFFHNLPTQFLRKKLNAPYRDFWKFE